MFLRCDMEHASINQMLDICNGFLVVFDFLVESFNLVGLYIHSILEAERLRNILADRQNADFAEDIKLITTSFQHLGVDFFSLLVIPNEIITHSKFDCKEGRKI